MSDDNKRDLNPDVVAGMAQVLGVANVVKGHSPFGSGPYEDAFGPVGIFHELDKMWKRLEDEGDAVLQEMLLRQAVATQAIFTSLAQRAAINAATKYHDPLMALALKAQSASRATIAALGELRNPRTTVFAKQVNAAAGNQQVNNSAAPGASAQKAIEPEKPGVIEMTEAPPIDIVRTVKVRATRTREKLAAVQKRTIGGKL